MNRRLVLEARTVWLKMIDHVQEQQYSEQTKSTELCKETSPTETEVGQSLQVIFDEM